MTDDHLPPGMKRTKQRMAVLSVLEDAASPQTAMDIHKQLEKSSSRVCLSTVYRVLEQFVAHGVAVKTTVHDNDMAFFERNRHSHRHWAVCVDCHKIVAINNCPLADFEPKISDDAFQVLGHRVEMYGYCKDCGKRKRD
ncbi:Fur family transcriptional regulator [Oscillospiraceae bacterium WX1]